MPSMNATIGGWRGRLSRSWYPTAGGFIPCSTDNGNNRIASCPTTNTGALSNNMFTVIIKLEMPTNTNIESIDSISVNIYPYDVTTDSTYLYGSLRTVDDSTSAQNSISDYRTYVAGGSAEAYCIPDNKASIKTIKFNGNFAPGATYYLWLYTKDTAEQFHLVESSSAYTCTINYTTKTYRVSYDANGGTGEPGYSEFEYNNTCTVSNTIPTRSSNSTNYPFTITGNSNGGSSNTTLKANKTITTSYVFKGWSLDPSATIADYNGGNTFSVTKDITLYAIWQSEDSASYSNNTLSLLPKPKKNPSSASYVFTLNYNNGSSQNVQTLEKSASYTFKGWSRTSTGNTISNSTTFTSATTVYAIWDVDGIDNTMVTLPIPRKDNTIIGKYTISLETNGGSVPNSSLIANINAIYTFKGWSTTNSEADIVGSPYLVTQNTTLNAIYESYSMTESVALPAAVKDSFRFTGWTEVSDSDIFVPNPYVPTKDITLYANYKVGRGIKAFLWHDNNWYRIMIDGI